MFDRSGIWKALAFAGLAMAGPACAQSLQGWSEFEGPLGVSWKLYGQISGGFMSVDDGFETDQALVDNGNSGTRIGITGERDIGTGIVSFTFETALGTRGSSQIGQTSVPTDSILGRRTLRFLEVKYQGPLGHYAIGQGSMATDGVAEIDFSGTSLAAYSFVSGAGGGFSFRDQSGALTPIIVSGVFRNFDGGRRLRIRYDTPEYRGFSIGAALGKEVVNPNDDNTYSDFSVRYSGAFGEIETSVAVGYGRIETPAGAVSEALLASASAWHKPSGISVTLATGAQQRGSAGSYDYLKLGYRKDWFTFGETRLSVDYYAGRDLLFTNSESQSVGVALVQDIDRYGIETFVLLRTYAMEDAGTTGFEDVTAFFAGARFKF